MPDPKETVSDPDTDMIAISHAEDPNLAEDEMIIYSNAEPTKKED